MSRTYCELCNASRGKAVYENGTWCFACSTLVPYKQIITKKYTPDRNKLVIKSITTPLPTDALLWLKKYYITNTYIEKYNITWEVCLQRILVPYYNHNFKWLRSINPHVKNKWLFQGNKNDYVFHFKSNPKRRTRSLVIVEDVISAIRVADFCDVVALGGTNFNSPLLVPLFLQYDELIAFFDGDKAGKEAAIKFKKRFHLIRKVRVINTKQDPKCYPPDELKEVLE